jgi:hypothetical protein
MASNMFLNLSIDREVTGGRLEVASSDGDHGSGWSGLVISKVRVRKGAIKSGAVRGDPPGSSGGGAID